MPFHHSLRSYHTLDEFLSSALGPGYSKAHKHYRFWVAKWNAWKAKHPGLPYRIKCALCSGQETRMDRKLGRWGTSRAKWQKEIWN